MRFAIAALLALVVVAPGCGRLSDQTWLRVLYFEGVGAEDSGQAISSVSSIVQTIKKTAGEKTRELGATDYVNVVFANQSTIVGLDGATAGGVTVDHVRITYTIAGYAPPDTAYTLTFYVPASATSTTSTTTDTATSPAKLNLALVGTDLKSWLADTVDETVLAGGLSASARLVFHALTDEGGELETVAGIGIVFKNVTTNGTTTSE